MADSTIDGLPTIAAVDRATDKLAIWDASAGLTGETTINATLGLTGNPVGHSDVQTLSNKTLGITNTVTLADSLFTLQDNSDNTKQAQFQLSGITTGTTRTYTLPNASGTLVDLASAQTLTNKTLTSPVINTATIANPTLTVDAISEFTSGAGVTIDGLLVKDGTIPDSLITPAKILAGTGTSWVWQSYSPSWTGGAPAIGNGTIVGKYSQVGKTVFYRIIVTMGSTTTYGAGTWAFSLPVTSTEGTTGFPPTGTYAAYDNSAGNNYWGGIGFASTTTVAGLINSISTAGQWGGTLGTTTPFTWAQSDILYIKGFYEAA
jgi:hypothetical protein